MYRGKEIFKPLNTGWIDENVACVREWVANIFFYRKGDTTIMIDAGYNYDRLAEKMCVKPTKVHLQAYPIIPTFASLNKEKNTTKNAVATTSSPALRTTFPL